MANRAMQEAAESMAKSFSEGLDGAAGKMGDFHGLTADTLDRTAQAQAAADEQAGNALRSVNMPPAASDAPASNIAKILGGSSDGTAMVKPETPAIDTTAAGGVHATADASADAPTVLNTPTATAASGVTHASTHATATTADFSGNAAFRSSAADQASFASSYSGYADDAQFVQNLKATNPALAHIPTADLVAVRGYTGNDFYGPMNAALRNGDAANLARYDPHIRTTASGLNQLPAATGTVYRGMTIDPANIGDVLSRYNPGETVTEPHFLSTATGSGFSGNVRFVVDSTTGRDVSALSHFPNESEILFPPGSQFNVTSKIEVSPGQWEIHMTDIG